MRVGVTGGQCEAANEAAGVAVVLVDCVAAAIDDPDAVARSAGINRQSSGVCIGGNKSPVAQRSAGNIVLVDPVGP